MADDATITISATILPDEIAKTFSGTMTVTPDDTNDKWYYKLTACTATSTNLIAGSFLDYTPVDDDTAPTAVATADKVKFLFIQNTSSGDGVYICFDGGTAAYNLADAVFIGPSQTWFARLPNTTVGNLHAISADIGDTGDATANLIVAALIDDVA
jgi:hypothetical protein